MQNERKIKDGKKARTVGFALLALASLLFIILLSLTKDGRLTVSSAGTNLALVTMMLSFPVSALLLLVGGIRGRRARRYRKYLPHALNERDIENLASIAGVPYRRAERDIAAMLGMGLLPGLRLDRAAKRLAEAAVSFAEGGFYGKNGALPPAPLPTVSVICPGCGAENSVQKGGAAKCEYCGAALEGK